MGKGRVIDGSSGGRSAFWPSSIHSNRSRGTRSLLPEQTTVAHGGAQDVPEKIPLSDTASYFALAYHSYNDPVVLKANQVEHLKMEELPPLSDRNWTRHLVKRSYNVSLVPML